MTYLDVIDKLEGIPKDSKKVGSYKTYLVMLEDYLRFV